MLNRKSLVILTGLLMITALMILISWSPATVTAQGPSATPQPPVAVLKSIDVARNATYPNVVTATISIITDTAVGPSKAVIANGTSGLSNVPINVPVFVQVSAADPKNSGKPTWGLTKPADSKATITGTMTAQFTPDVVGAYMVSVSLKGDNGTSATQYMTFHAGTYIGESAGNCKQCHPTKDAEWAKTGHAHIVADELDNKLTPDVASHYSETCFPCHTTGYWQPGANNGGFVDAQTKAGWKFPTFAQINAAGKGTGPSNYDAMPAEVKNMANIQCENCHGPASEHVKNGANVMAVSFTNDACNTCHAVEGHHNKGNYEANSKHVTGASFEEVTGPGEQACQRCHSGAGFASFLQNPTNQAAWANEESYVGCSTCHDPHSDANFAQLRVVGKPVQVPFDNAKDVGLSAGCETCHNNRTNPANAVKGSYPHYSSAAEMLSDTGGVTYGQTVANSPHSMMIGMAPVPDPADKTGKTMLYNGTIPGPCVTCHMGGKLTDAKDPNMLKVADHSFNMVSPDGSFENATVCTTCHGKLTSFDLPAKADYDGNGKAEGVQTEVKGLLNVLWTDLQAKGLKKIDTGYPYATVPKNADGTTDPKIANAWYNYRYVYGVMWGTDADGKPTVGGEGKAAAVHNFKRSVSLLQLSIKDLTGSLPSGMTELK